MQGNTEAAILFAGRETKDDMSDKDIDLTPNDYRVNGGKRKEPFFIWANLPAFLAAILALVLAKAAFLWAIGKLPL